MLVLTRRTGEVIAIGDDVAVIVLESRGGQIKLGIVAPKTIRVNRAELDGCTTPAVVEAVRRFVGVAAAERMAARVKERGD